MRDGFELGMGTKWENAVWFMPHSLPSSQTTDHHEF